MSLTLYLHPLASFCHKVLLALYENGTAFEPYIVDLMNDKAAARYLDLWPVGKIPVLRDEARDLTLPETSIIIEDLDRHYPGPTPLIPADPDMALEVRLWDRFFDQYVMTPMSKIVVDRIRPEGGKDPHGVTLAYADLKTAYGVVESRMAGRSFVAGNAFSMADCAAAPALFYAATLVPFGDTYPTTGAYFERLLARPSFQHVLAEARPYFKFYPYVEQMPARFLE